MVDSSRVVERYIDEVLSGDGPSELDVLVANAVLRQKVAALRSAFPDLRVTVQQLAGHGDMIAVHATATGTHRGLFQGIPPHGRRWSGTCTGIYRVVDGQIADFWENWDLLSILEQLGGVKRSAGASA
jgi:predicted ester cyclase